MIESLELIRKDEIRQQFFEIYNEKILDYVKSKCSIKFFGLRTKKNLKEKII